MKTIQVFGRTVTQGSTQPATQKGTSGITWEGGIKAAGG
jgi:hypothetical protein